jgi:hypothetical protein
MTSTTLEIHPAIGVARLGSSRDPTADGFFYEREPGGSPPEFYCDPAGDLKRQAAGFRLFQCVHGADRRLLEASEISHSEARITWEDQGPRSRNRSRVDGDKRIDSIEPRSYLPDAWVDQTEARNSSNGGRILG